MKTAEKEARLERPKIEAEVFLEGQRALGGEDSEPTPH